MRIASCVPLLLMVCQMISVVSAQERTPVAITIDDLPGLGAEDLVGLNASLIEKLKANQWSAVCFVNEGGLYNDGRLDSARYSTLQLWLENGFELGNHTFSHLNYHKTDTASFFQDIMKGEELTRPLSESYGMPYRYFRHPYLRNGQSEEKKVALNQFLQRHNYQVAPVTIDNAEWIYAQAYRKAKRAKDQSMLDSIGQSYVNYMVDMSNYYRQQARELVGRDIPHILLIHARELNADLLDDLLKALEREQFEIIPLEEVLKDPVYQLEDGYFGAAGISWIERWAMSQSMPGTFYSGIPRCPQFIQDYSGLKE